MYKSVIAANVYSDKVKLAVQNKINEYKFSKEGRKYNELESMRDDALHKSIIFNIIAIVNSLICLFDLLYLITIYPPFKDGPIIDLDKLKEVISTNLLLKVSVIIFICLIVSSITFFILYTIYNRKWIKISREIYQVWYPKMDKLAEQYYIDKKYNIFYIDKIPYLTKMTNLFEAIDKLHKWSLLNNTDNSIEFECYTTDKNLICVMLVDNRRKDKIKINNDFFTYNDYAKLINHGDTLDFSFIDKVIDKIYGNILKEVK